MSRFGLKVKAAQRFLPFNLFIILTACMTSDFSKPYSRTAWAAADDKYEFPLGLASSTDSCLTCNVTVMDVNL